MILDTFGLCLFWLTVVPGSGSVMRTENITYSHSKRAASFVYTRVEHSQPLGHIARCVSDRSRNGSVDRLTDLQQLSRS